jgi:LuxR family maltose regulon positive regulatory protein
VYLGGHLRSKAIMVPNDKVVSISTAAPSPGRDSDTEGHWLLLGKLVPPHQRVIAAHRAALLARLDASTDAAVSVIVSPPGFGKTTLLTQWWQTLRARDNVAACWLTLDEADSEVTRFMAGLILAVAKGGVDVGALEIVARQQSLDANVRPIVATFLAAVRRSARRVVLILDDYHPARSPAVDAILEILIEHGHPALHLVVSSRQRPTFHVAALSARGLVTALDAADLAMSQSEAAEIIGPGVSEADLALLHARTEGWAVALQLARLWLDRGQRRPGSLREFSGRTMEMTGYLAEQIIQDLSPDLREFLLETSILERFDANLANAVRGHTDSAEILERLAHFDALLVPLEGPRDSFRYHAMFADFLTQRLHRGPAGRVCALHKRAARWLADAGDLLEAVKHAIKAGDTRLAVQLVQESGGWELILWRGIGYVRTLLKNFSDMTIRAAPGLQIMQAYLDMKLGDYDSALELLGIVEAFLESAGPRIKRDFLIVSAIGRGYLDEVEASDGGRSYEAELQELDPSDHLGRGTLLSIVALTALANADVDGTERASRAGIQQMRAAGSILGTNYFFLHLGQSQLQAGKLREAEALYREALVMAEENFGADSGLKALSATFLAESLYLRDDLPGSAQLIEASCETIEAADGWLDVYATAYEVMTRQAFATRGLDATLQTLSRVAETARRRRLKRLAALSAAWRVEYLALSGQIKDARREAKVAGLAAYAETRGKPDYRWRVRLAATIALCRLSVASGASAYALKLLDGASVDYRSGGLLLPAYRLDALSVLALKQRGGSDAEAVRRLEALIRFIVAEGAWRLVLEEGAALESLLHLAQRRNRELVLSSAQRDVTVQLLAKLQSARPPDEHGFSSRELAVLRELCNGRSNKVIGQLLDLSENTVKFHLKRIFKKLDVDSRAGAITKALQRGIAEVAVSTKSMSRP